MERAERDRLYFAPFREYVAAHLDERVRIGRPTVLIGMHSFTPVYLGAARVWQAGVLYLQARALGQALIAGLRAAEPSFAIGDNEPYKVTPEGDYTVPWQGDCRGIPAALFEVRQDLIADAPGAAAWAERLAGVLASAGTAP